MEEIWKDIVGFEKYYQVSNLGRIKTKSTGKVRKQGITRGYPSFTFQIKGKAYNLTVHRIVAKAFIPNPNNYEVVNHKDGNKTNNNVDNLEWCTTQHNVREAYRLGLMNISEKHIEQMRNLGLKSGKRIAQKDLQGNIIKIYRSGNQASIDTNISQGLISLCCNNKRKTAGGYKWEYLEKEA